MNGYARDSLPYKSLEKVSKSKKKPKTSQQKKTAFRATRKWTKFRELLKMDRPFDELTLKPLRKGWNLHHMDLREENYEDLSDEDNFMCLNKMTHQLIHDGYRYYEKDPEFGERVLKCWERMYEINHKGNDD